MSIPDFTLRQLSYLVAVADESTLASAAARLHVSPSALSDAITELETALGAQLTVRRRARGVSLTSAGQHIVSRARTLLADARELALALRTTDGDLVGPIVIGCYPALAPTILPPLLHDFADAHPRVDLQIREVAHDLLEGQLESGEIDVAFGYDSVIPGAHLRKQLFALPAHVLLSAADPLAAHDTVRLEEVAERDLILLDSGPSRMNTLSLFSARGLTPRIRHRTASYEAVRTLVGRGLGYGILVQRPANPASYEGYPVVMKEISPPAPPVGIDVIWSSSTTMTARTQALIEFAGSVRWPGQSA